MNKKEIINALVDYYCSGDNGEFAKKIGIAPQTLSTWKARNTIDFEAIYANCEGINGNWLLSNGEGEMLLNKTSPASKDTRDGKNVEVGSEVISLLNKIEDEHKSINANFHKLRTALELAGRPQADKQKLADAARQVDKIREQYASGELGRRNRVQPPLVDKGAGRKK